MSKRQAQLADFLLVLAALLSITVSVAYGPVGIPADIVYAIIGSKLSGQLSAAPSWEQGSEVIIWQFRLPRVLLAGLAGAVLSLIGILLQTLTRNSLAEPYVLGVSAGASAGAVGVIVLGLFSWGGGRAVELGACIGAFTAILALVLFAGGSRDPVRLILVGIGVAAFFSAVTTLIIYLAKNDSQLRSAMFWMVGSFASVKWADLGLPALFALVFFSCALFLHKELDLLLLGSDEARKLGVPVHAIQWSLIVMASSLVAVIVAKVGVIGFVGLVVPHIARKLFGVSHRRLLPAAALLGAIFLIWADTIARTCFSPEELPVGVITALAGAPIFISMIRRNYRFG
ncbi:MAG: iron ABC transporter permease [Sporomusaceae bacterium]|nr:iron ABC transporter permease [Sporomusaceae bacterium]